MIDDKNEFKIKKVIAREVLDSRGNPTIESTVYLNNGISSRAIVPSGASTGIHEALELRDVENKKRYFGKGVLKAIKNVVEIISPKIAGISIFNQEEIDNTMINLDGTPNKSKLGSNAILSVSLACVRAAAMALGIPLYKYIHENYCLRMKDKYIMPIPLMNILNGGKHAGNKLAIQEFMIMPVGKKSFSENLRVGVEVYHELKNYLKTKFGRTAINVGDEGGFAPPLSLTKDAIDAILLSIDECGYTPGKDVFIALDAAASVFYNEGKYEIDGKKLTKDDLMDFYIDLTNTYPILSIEDPFFEDDFQAFSELNRKIGHKVQIVGDDLFVTNINRLKIGVKNHSANALLLKVNQIGTFTEAIQAAKYAINSKMNLIVSHRSGETEDPFIADLAVGINSGQIKTGAPARGERTAKYNQLLRIEDSLDRFIYGYTIFSINK
ncbi:MAG: phosphopyruvate hydratase [Candidatus Asgardarchaeia archaeon]